MSVKTESSNGCVHECPMGQWLMTHGQCRCCRCHFDKYYKVTNSMQSVSVALLLLVTSLGYPSVSVILGIIINNHKTRRFFSNSICSIITITNKTRILFSISICSIIIGSNKIRIRFSISVRRSSGIIPIITRSVSVRLPIFVL